MSDCDKPDPSISVAAGGVPRCREACRHHDGKRRGLLGLRARDGDICEPAVVDIIAERDMAIESARELAREKASLVLVRAAAARFRDAANASSVPIYANALRTAADTIDALTPPISDKEVPPSRQKPTCPVHGDAAQLAKERAYWDARALREAGLEPPDPLTAAQPRIAELESQLSESAAYAEQQRSRAAVAEQQQATCMATIAELEATLAASKERCVNTIERLRASHTAELDLMTERAWKAEEALARVRELPLRWRTVVFGFDCADELESALAPPNKST